MNSAHRLLRRHAALALAMLGALGASAPARAGVTWIEWNNQGAFERTIQIAPGQFAEVCAKLVKGQAVAWSFAGPVGLNFNVHYHAGKESVYFARKDDVARLEGELNAPVDQTYCWMWTNQNAAAASLGMRMEKRP